MANQELITARVETPKGGSDRGFGLVFATVFAIIGLWPFVIGTGGRPMLWALAISAAFLAVSLTKPALLARPNQIWTKFSILLSKIVNPIVLGVMFFGVITPTAIGLRLTGRDILGKAFDKDAKSYWSDRVPPGPPPDSIKNQF